MYGNPEISPIVAEIEILSILFKSLIYQVKKLAKLIFFLTQKAQAIHPGL